jgi:hypothetical protein
MAGERRAALPAVTLQVVYDVVKKPSTTFSRRSSRDVVGAQTQPNRVAGS